MMEPCENPRIYLMPESFPEVAESLETALEQFRGIEDELKEGK